MGRFKVYDAKKLVNVLNDPTYAKCLLCERKLKNIMGNIKRHYEQMHSVYVDANVKRVGKRKKYEEDKNFKPNKNLKKSIEAKEIINTEITETSTPVSTNTNSSTVTNSITILELSDSDSTDDCQSSVGATKRSKVELNSFSNSPILEIKQDESNKHQTDSNTKIEPQHRTAQNLNLEKYNLNEENEDIQIPCNSFINNIQISSLEACHQVEFFKCLVETKAQLNIPVQNFEKGETIQKALQVWKQNFQFNYSSQIIGEHIDRLANKLRQEIVKMLDNRIIYLKLDVASNKQRNVMLVNIQFINDFEIKVITLSALELFDDNLPTYLTEKVLTALERYKIDISSVFSITKDNANNGKEYIQPKEKGAENCQIQMESHEPSIHSQYVEYCQHLCKQFPGHAIHFVACDIIKLLNENICQSRDSAKSLQRQLSHLKIKELPVLDNTTSWFSIYDMIKSLINIRETAETSKVLVEVDWIFAVKFLESFKPIVDTALMLQTDKHLTMGDFYREWLLCELEMKELSASNELALYLLEALHKHKKDFFENASFLAAIYLDPRFCYMGSMYLNDTQKDIAISELLQIFNKIKTMQSNNNSASIKKSTDANLNDRYIKLEEHVTERHKTIKSNYETTSLNSIDCEYVKEALKHLQFEERLPFNTNILDYWKMAKYKSPILAKIAEIALAAPATQATINRALIAWPIILKNNKHNGNSENMEKLLLLNLNQDLVDKISLA